MRLHRFEIRNFKAIEYVNVEWDDLLVLIGENNCGKSSVLAALSCFLSGSSIKDASLYRRHLTESQNAIELIGHFDELTDIEQQQVAVRGRMTNGQWVLKKRFWFEAGGDGGDGERGGWKEQLFSLSSVESLDGWPEADAAWANFPADYQQLIQQLPNRGARPSNATREALRELVRARRPDLIRASPPDWVPNPGGGGNWKSNANSIIPHAIFVRAVHEASDETNAKDASTYGKLINLIVERQLSQRPEMTALQRALDAGYCSSSGPTTNILSAKPKRYGSCRRALTVAWPKSLAARPLSRRSHPSWGRSLCRAPRSSSRTHRQPLRRRSAIRDMVCKEPWL